MISGTWKPDLMAYIVFLKDGTEIRCKNPFPKVALNQKVKIKETATGNWIITQ